LPDDATQVLQKITNSVTFLMVGTVEPRKGHAQALEAFELLWQEGHQCQLVIVGKPGWNVNELVSKISANKEKGKRLFWLQNISDEYLRLVYENASCLLACSEGEGFGLPLIEAAKNNLPILVRDIAVFREVGKNNATYFSAADSYQLKQVIAKWIKDYLNNIHIDSQALLFRTWDEFTTDLIRYLDTN
jgi:glycosyltransferase involved in cell wall biosynthesis